MANSFVGIKEGSEDHKMLVDTYNRHKPLARNYKLKYTDAWCAGFISTIAILVNATDIIPCEVSANNQRKKFEKLGNAVAKDDSRYGDIVYYDWDGNGTADHVGVVYSRNGNTIQVVEGNKNDAVGVRTISLGKPTIKYVFRPNYTGETTNRHGSDKRYSDSLGIDVVAHEVIRGKWGVGATRRQRLSRAGYNWQEVQKRVNELLGQ